MSRKELKDEATDDATVQPAVREGSGAKGGKDTLKPEEQEPSGVEPDSEIDAKLRGRNGKRPSGLDPNSIVRNG
ncbi:MAG TPA: hypothetical protein VGE69_14670 [Pseudomonadales bacterium]